MDIIKKYEPIFGAWYVDKFIGAGSFGRVYRIKREELGTCYYSALKFFSIPQSDEEIEQLHFDGMDDESIEAYYEELVKEINEENLIMSKLKGHTNIVNYEDSRVVKKDSGIGYNIFIRMELLKSLPQYIKTHTFSRADVIKLGIDMCKALEICANSNIIHRDIKPDNIFVNENGDFKLGDFGIARRLDEAASFMSKKGTYSYMAPEVYKGEMYDASVDIYSLGMVMYRFMNGNRLPFLPLDPKPVTPQDKELSITMRMKGEKIPLPCYAKDELGETIIKACAFNVKDRFRTPTEMRVVLENILEKETENVAVPGITPSNTDSLSTSSRSNFTPVSLSSSGKENGFADNINMQQPTRSKAENSERSFDKTPTSEKIEAVSNYEVQNEISNKTQTLNPNASNISGYDNQAEENQYIGDANISEFISESKPLSASEGNNKEKKKGKIWIAAIIAGVAAIACAAIFFVNKLTDGEKGEEPSRVANGGSALFSEKKSSEADPDEYSGDVGKSQNAKTTAKPSPTVLFTPDPKKTPKAEKTPTPTTPPPGVWSDWTDTKPSNYSDIEDAICYRYRDWYYTSSTNKNDKNLKDKGYWLTGQSTVVDEGKWDKEWSDKSWSTTKREETETLEREERVEHRVRVKQDIPRSPYRLDNSEYILDHTEFEPSGDWSTPSTTKVEETDKREVKTEKRTVKEYFLEHYCSSSGVYPSASYCQGGYEHCELGWYTEDELEKKGYTYSGTVYGKKMYICRACGENDCAEYFATKEDSKQVTYYSYRNGQRYYYYYKWGNWSNPEYYGKVPPTNNNRQQVEAVTTYRYRTKTIAYGYAKCTAWSKWQTKPISKTDTREVEQKRCYRYKVK